MEQDTFETLSRELADSIIYAALWAVLESQDIEFLINSETLADYVMDLRQGYKLLTIELQEGGALCFRAEYESLAQDSDQTQ
jgi:hypothetical protein